MVRKPAERPEYPVENQRPIIFERENSGRKVLETIEIHKILSKTEQKKLAEREMPKILTYEERAIAKREQNLGVYSEEFLVREALRTDRAIPDHKHGDHHGKRLDYDAKTPVILTRSQKLLIEKNRIRNAFMIKELLERKEF